MTKAEKMRELVKGMEERDRQNRVSEHVKYVNKIINTKISNLASKGKTQYEMRVPKKMSRVLFNDELQFQGFQTNYKSKFGRQYIVVKW